MKLGFTGTRRGMTAAQEVALTELFIVLKPTEFHHGLCQGADVEAHDVLCDLPVAEGCQIVGHPGPDNDPCRQERSCDELREPKTHFARNRDIVAACDRLIATPAQMEHQPRGGTWYSVDHARKKGVPVTIIWPDGTVEES